MKFHEELNGEIPEKFISPLNVYWKNCLYCLTLVGIFPFGLIFLIGYSIEYFSHFKQFISQLSIYVFFILSAIIACLIIIARYVNHSFYVYEKNMILRVINPYFPFKKDKLYTFDEIHDLHFLRYTNRLIITFTNGQSKIYLCDCLQNDYYDEHFVEKTFDDFFDRMTQLGLKTSLNSKN
jgi:hypothetical protein